MQFKLKSFKKKAYLFDSSELASKEAFKTAVHGFLSTSWTSEEIKADLPEEGQQLVAEWIPKIDAAIDGLDPECFPINENSLDLLWMESSDVWDGIDEGDYSDLNMLFEGFVKSIENQGGDDFDASSEPMVTGDRKATEKCPDCGVEAGQNHLDWCNSAEITKKTFPNQASYNAETKMATFKLKAYPSGNGHIYRPESDEVGTFIVVSKPTKVSTVDDVMFECNLGSLMLQSRGGLEPSDILRVFKRENAEAARQFAEQVILQEMNRPDDDSVPSPIL
jgi:hypothetical protein